jgi:hypothetical protein
MEPYDHAPSAKFWRSVYSNTLDFWENQIYMQHLYRYWYLVFNIQFPFPTHLSNRMRLLRAEFLPSHSGKPGKPPSLPFEIVPTRTHMAACKGKSDHCCRPRTTLETWSASLTAVDARARRSRVATAPSFTAVFPTELVRTMLFTAARAPDCTTSMYCYVHPQNSFGAQLN